MTGVSSGRWTSEICWIDGIRIGVVMNGDMASAPLPPSGSFSGDGISRHMKTPAAMPNSTIAVAMPGRRRPTGSRFGSEFAALGLDMSSPCPQEKVHTLVRAMECGRREKPRRTGMSASRA